MKKLIPILAVFLILSTLFVSCGKIEKYILYLVVIFRSGRDDLVALTQHLLSTNI